MKSAILKIIALCSTWPFISCSPTLSSDAAIPHVTPGAFSRKVIRERLTAILVSSDDNIDSWLTQGFHARNAPKDADGGSAVPITADGYFLTADHVLARSDQRNVFVIYGNGGKIFSSKARIVWRSAADDIALLHIPHRTPYFYSWTPPNANLSPGHGIIHGGMSTGHKESPGKIRTPLPAETFFTGNRSFKIDIPLQPGDSGGPVVDAYGNLVGINSAVEFLIPLETAIFIDSEANRPNTRKITSIIQKDRIR